ALLASLAERERFLLRGFDYQEADLAAARGALTVRTRKGDRAAEIDLRAIKALQQDLPGRRDRALAILRHEPELIGSGELRHLATALVVPTADPAERERHNREVELIAMKVVRAFEEARGSKAIDVHTPEL